MNAFVAGGVALAVLAVGNSALSISQALLRSERTVVTELDGQVNALELDVDSGDVQVVASDRTGAVVERTETWSLERPSVVEQADGGVLRVRADCAALLSWCEVSYVVRVPRGTTVLARTGSGGLVAHGTGDVRAQTGSGEIVLTAVDGSADVRSGSGDVVVEGLRGRSVVARTGSGDVVVSRAAVDRVDGRTGSGQVVLGLREVPDEVRARTGSGDVQVLLPSGDEAYAVTVDTGSGDEVVDVAEDRTSSRVIDLETGSGDVTVGHGAGPP